MHKKFHVPSKSTNTTFKKRHSFILPKTFGRKYKKNIYEEHMAGDLMVLIPLDSISRWTEYRHMISGPVILYEL